VASVRAVIISESECRYVVPESLEFACAKQKGCSIALPRRIVDLAE
jgi:hypothetical protein